MNLQLPSRYLALPPSSRKRARRRSGSGASCALNSGAAGAASGAGASFNGRAGGIGLAEGHSPRYFAYSYAQG